LDAEKHIDMIISYWEDTDTEVSFRGSGAGAGGAAKRSEETRVELFIPVLEFLTFEMGDVSRARQWRVATDNGSWFEKKAKSGGESIMFHDVIMCSQ
jgi:hypothetical protein